MPSVTRRVAVGRWWIRISRRVLSVYVRRRGIPARSRRWRIIRARRRRIDRGGWRVIGGVRIICRGRCCSARCACRYREWQCRNRGRPDDQRPDGAKKTANRRSAPLPTRGISRRNCCGKQSCSQRAGCNNFQNPHFDPSSSEPQTLSYGRLNELQMNGIDRFARDHARPHSQSCRNFWSNCRGLCRPRDPVACKA